MFNISHIHEGLKHYIKMEIIALRVIFVIFLLIDHEYEMSCHQLRIARDAANDTTYINRDACQKTTKMTLHV